MSFSSSSSVPGVSRKPLLIAMSLCGIVWAGSSLAQPPIVQPGAPGEPSRQISADEASNLAALRFTDADVTFMQNMIVHHRQALDMSVLVEERTQRDSVRDLAQRIALSQEDEIELMESWLRERNLPIESDTAHHDHDLMAGMITDEEMEELAAADGADFDNLFLELMIKHHQGAVTMVEELLGSYGSAQDSLLFEFTSEVTADQTAEIERMTGMLAGFSPDPRVNLAAGFRDAGEATLNMELLAALPKPEGFYDPENPAGLPMSRLRELEQEDDAPEVEEDETSEPRPSLLNFANTDIAFTGDVMVAGNYHGFINYDISNPLAPQLISSVVCPGGQGDVSVVGNLLFMSVEQTRGRLDCGLQGVAEPVSDQRFRGIRIFDVSDFSMPVQVGAVQTCRGSHTHTVIPDPDDPDRIYLYNSGTSSVRPEEELGGCIDESPYRDENTARFRIDIIEVPLNRPQESRIVNRPFVFMDPESGVIAGLWEGGDHGAGTNRSNETNHCHDITAFPELGLAAGACSGNGILFDISDPVNPQRLDDVIDPGFAYWHSATFSNDGRKVIFTDEWGGGSRARCRAFDPKNWGANAIYDVVDGKLEFRSHYKLPAPQSEQENCVAHNGSLVPVPGRDIFVQAWYQGGISVKDFTDSSNPVEIAFFDRGPIDEKNLVMGGYWSAYWYEGKIYGTEIARGLDVLQLLPSDYLSEAEIAAASLPMRGDQFNPQNQRRIVWQAEPVVARAYLDQLRRSGSVMADHDSALESLLQQSEGLLARDRTAAPGTIRQLESMRDELSAVADTHEGRTATRYAGIADTLDGLIQRLQ